jgi:hypothetical protein
METNSVAHAVAHAMRNELGTCSEERETGAFLKRKKQILSLMEAHMTSRADESVPIQTSLAFVSSTPSWFGEVVLMVASLRKHDVLTKVAERVRSYRADTYPHRTHRIERAGQTFLQQSCLDTRHRTEPSHSLVTASISCSKACRAIVAISGMT